MKHYKSTMQKFILLPYNKLCYEETKLFAFVVSKVVSHQTTHNFQPFIKLKIHYHLTHV